MMYDPHWDFYALLVLPSDASREEIESALTRAQGQANEPAVEEARQVLLDTCRRAQYDTARAASRIRRLLTPALGLSGLHGSAAGVASHDNDM